MSNLTPFQRAHKLAKQVQAPVFITAIGGKTTTIIESAGEPETWLYRVWPDGTIVPYRPPSDVLDAIAKLDLEEPK